ncbi:hypothetical protein [Paraburkholderia youngii]|uniref:hypothetical protein n=1 Tax=Paraburkholderia sp. BR10954 TaxID=3236995 RepID=UPI001C3D1701|nr:hypothetical protein [Paraburkholderia youngii]
MKKRFAAALSRRFCSRMSSSAPCWSHCPPEQIRLTAQRNEDFVKMPCAARFAASSFDAMCEARAEFVAPAADRLVTDNDTALEQQFFNITQAKMEPEIPPNRETNDCRREDAS